MITVPENTIVAIPFRDEDEEFVSQILIPMQGDKRRDWFVNHAYFCLPLLIGNQYGIGVRSLVGFEAIWTGGVDRESIAINFDEEDGFTHHPAQTISSHFGMGTITIQNQFTLRTPPGVNLMTINPPNYWIDGVAHMTGVVETDNLRRDFTLNLKLTRPGHRVRINKGDLVGCLLPVPRYFCDGFDVVNSRNLLTDEEISEERKCMEAFGEERSTKDIHKKHRNGRRYYRGEDIYGNKFPDHQRSVPPRTVK